MDKSEEKYVKKLFSVFPNRDLTFGIFMKIPKCCMCVTALLIFASRIVQNIKKENLQNNDAQENYSKNKIHTNQQFEEKFQQFQEKFKTNQSSANSNHNRHESGNNSAQNPSKKPNYSRVNSYRSMASSVVTELLPSTDPYMS